MPKNSLPIMHCTGLSDTVRALTPTAVLVRILPVSRAVTYIFEGDFWRLIVDRAIERQVTRMIRQHFASVADWRYAHDFHVPSGRLYLTPEPAQKGYVPEDDSSFGMSPTRYVATADGGAR
ncbi:hypothetical protein ACWGLE_16125 [Streptomyces sp. NPDC055897]